MDVRDERRTEKSEEEPGKTGGQRERKEINSRRNKQGSEHVGKHRNRDGPERSEIKPGQNKDDNREIELQVPEFKAEKVLEHERDTDKEARQHEVFETFSHIFPSF